MNHGSALIAGLTTAELLPRLMAVGEGPYLLAAVVALVTVEGLLALALKRKPDLREEAASWGVGIGYFFTKVLGAKLLFFGLYLYVYQHCRLFEWRITAVRSWLTLLLIGDFVYYWTHRMEHRVRLFWATHENHHSARTFTFGTAVRMPWGEVLYAPIIGVWAPLLGFHPAMYPVVGAFNLVCGLLQHTELVGKLGPLEAIFATPSHHRVHHGSDPQYLDCNYGARLILWDRLFGTFRPEGATPRYGLTKNIESYNPLVIVAHGYLSLYRDVRGARTLVERLKILFGPPERQPERLDPEAPSQHR